MSFLQIFNSIISFWNSQPVQRIFISVKIFFIILFFILLGSIIFFLLKTKFLRYIFVEDLIEFLSFKPYGASKIRKRWDKIRKRLESRDESDWKVAVIEADQLLGNLLEEKGYEGADNKEKLRQVGTQLLSSFDDFLEAYEIYKCVSEDPSYKLDKKDADKFLDRYESVMEDLGFLS